MDASLWARIRDAFSFVISHDTAAAHTALLKVCEGDDQLLLHLRPLVEEHFRILNDPTASRSSETSVSGLPDILAGRYRVLAQLGRGSFGEVYRVLDQGDNNIELALKILRSSDPLALYYFKREFRSLTDIYHRNIVHLRELILHEGQWILTMEFVNGVNLIRFLEDQLPTNRDAALRSCLVQLSEGLSTLHERGLLHRDVKPSNVLVTTAGRVVLLDFGLVRPFDRDSQSLLTFAGTPEYISPEVASGMAAGEASDWYAVGVLMYQSLTGRLPFAGSFIEVLHRKQVETPAPPSDFGPVALDLNSLCLSLLERDPCKRASYEDVVRALQPSSSVSVRESRKPPIVGRSELLQQLIYANAGTDERPTVIHLCGPSGIGKTAVLREFVTRLSSDPSALAFAGRCYESEAVPHQALDDLVDQIVQYFRRLRRDEVERLLPRNFASLVKMFPVLTPFLFCETKSVPSLNSTELRIRGLAALRELLGRLRERHRIVLIVDDLQWGELDGCMALTDLLCAADSPPILAVFAYRSEDIATNAPLKYLRDNTRQSLTLTSRLIELDHLASADCGQLIESLLRQPVAHDTVQRIMEQSGGSPFLIHEIVRWVKIRGVAQASRESFSLGDMVRARIDELSGPSKHLLELAAIAGQPTSWSILELASGISDLVSARDELLSSRFLRSRVVRGLEEIEIYHDRIRTTILEGLDHTVLVQRHGEFAAALEALGMPDLQRIAQHYERAGKPQLCAKYALMAADRASDVLAFNDAARFFEMALATGSLESEACRIVHSQCADALAKAGRGGDAADHFFAACEGATGTEQLEWNLRAAEELLYSGHVDRGLEVFGTVLRAVGIRASDHTRFLPLNLLIRRMRLRIRGLHWRERSPQEIARHVLLKIDTCCSVATGLALIDLLRGAALQTTSLILALDAGEPRRIARALAMEAGYQSCRGVKAQRSAADLLRMARDLSNRTGDLRARGITDVMAAACAWTVGHWEACHELASTARAGLRERRENVTWERDTASIFEVEALRWMGRWSRMKAILPELIEDARQRGDLYAGSLLQMHGGSCAELANDDPARALYGLKLVERWSSRGFHVEHLVETHNQVEIALYLGQAERALEIITQRWSALSKSYLLEVQNFNIQMRSLRARAALAVAWARRSRVAQEHLIVLVDRDCRAIEREGTTWGEGISALIRASAEMLAGNVERGILRLQHAEASFDSSKMLLHRAIARRMRALLAGGPTARDLVRETESELAIEGITNLERFCSVIAPGRYAC